MRFKEFKTKGKVGMTSLIGWLLKGALSFIRYSHSHGS